MSHLYLICILVPLVPWVPDRFLSDFDTPAPRTSHLETLKTHPQICHALAGNQPLLVRSQPSS